MSFLTIAPVFALIFAGWAVGKTRIFSDSSVESLNNYTVYLALPALLFQFVAEANLSEIWHADFSLAFGISTFAIFIGFYLVGKGRLSSLQRSIRALSASYANTAFLGIPIAEAVFGSTGVAGAIIASLLTVALLFAISVLFAELGLHQAHGVWVAFFGALKATLKNPLVAAPLAGLLWMATGWSLPTPVATATGLLGASAPPVALVTIGLFLATVPRSNDVDSKDDENNQGTAAILVLKLLIHPLLVWGLVLLFDVPKPWGMIAILIAAMPTGTGPFMLAQIYRVPPVVPARAITISTVLSVFSLALLISWA